MRRTVFDRADHLLLLRIPPFVRQNAMPVCVGAGKQGSVSGCSPRVGIVVLTVREVSASLKKRAKSAVAKLFAKSFKVIGAKLVDDDDDDQAWMAVVSGGRGGRHHGQQEQCNQTDSEALLKKNS